MVAAVKAHYNVKEKGFAMPLRIVLSRRPDRGKASTRLIRNADELAASLERRGFEVLVSAVLFQACTVTIVGPSNVVHKPLSVCCDAVAVQYGILQKVPSHLAGL